MNSGNTKTSDRNRLNLSAKIDLKRSDKYVLLYSIKSYHIQYMEKHQKVMQKKKNKVSATIWNENFDLSHKLYFVSDIQYYFQHIIKKHVTVTDNPSRKIYANQIENMITFRITTKYYFELLPPETMKIH